MAEERFSETSKYKANNKYIKENYKQVKLSMPNQEAEELDAFCKARNLSKAGLIREAIKREMNRILEEEKSSN